MLGQETTWPRLQLVYLPLSCLGEWALGRETTGPRANYLFACADVRWADRQHLGLQGAMSVVDSKAAFAARCAKIGLPDGVVETLDKKGWGTHATFAFSTAVVPGSGDDSKFVKEVLEPILGSATHEQAANLRRLHFESYTLTAADLKRQTETSENDLPRKMPPAEVAERINLLQKKLTPLVIEEQLEPSHQVVNWVAQMVEDQRVKYLEWSKVTTRGQEINSLREVSGLKVFQPDRSGLLKSVSMPSPLTSRVDTELDVFNALRRRGVAYELGGAMSFSVHETLLNLLFRELQREPLPGFAPVTLAQLAAADREVHVRLGELTRGGLAPGPKGELPLDIPLAKVLDSSAVMWTLMPRPKTGAGSASSVATGHVTGQGDSQPGNKRKPQGKKGKTQQAEERKKRRRVSMPAALCQHGVPATEGGEDICFGHNLGTCSHKGHKCPKGLHVCCVAKCFAKDHNYLSHPWQ